MKRKSDNGVLTVFLKSPAEILNRRFVVGGCEAKKIFHGFLLVWGGKRLFTSQRQATTQLSERRAGRSHI